MNNKMYVIYPFDRPHAIINQAIAWVDILAFTCLFGIVVFLQPQEIPLWIVTVLAIAGMCPGILLLLYVHRARIEIVGEHVVSQNLFGIRKELGLLSSITHVEEVGDVVEASAKERILLKVSMKCGGDVEAVCELLQQYGDPNK